MKAQSWVARIYYPVVVRRGYSMAEAIVSMLIITLFLVSLVTLFPSSALAVRRAENRLHAGWLAQSAVERLRGTPWKDLGLYETDLAEALYGGTVFSCHQE